MNKAKPIVLAVALALVASATPAFAQEFVANGDFENGNTGFTSDYAYSPGDVSAPGSYTVDTNPRNSHFYFYSMGDHTTGTGQMMIINGASTTGIPVWKSSAAAALTVGQQYEFSVWVASVYPESPAELRFKVGSTSLGTRSPSPDGTWSRLLVTFTAQEAFPIFSLINANGAYSGNDFALDDIEISPRKTLQVTNTNDSGPGSLREAVIAANGSARKDTIEIQTTGVIRLTSGPLQVENSGGLTIVGPGKNLLTVSGNNNSRVFFIKPSADTVSISGMTITGGNSLNSEFPGHGGGIYNRGNLTVTDVRITENSATIDGGGLYNGIVGSAGKVTINSSIITKNRCDSDNNGFGSGGGLYNRPDGTMTINNSTISRNTTGNHANSVGGGIMTTLDSTLKVTNSAITDHSIFSNGGGIYIYRAAVNITNSTIGKNSAARGGGIFNADAKATIRIFSSTIARNHATSNAGGLRAGGILKIGNSILAENTAAGNAKDCLGTLMSEGYNLIKNTNGTTIQGTTTGNIIGANALLAPLAKNGGPTRTFAPQEGSPAIDMGNPTTFPPRDQRGVARPQDGDGNGQERADIGAFEVKRPEPTS